MISKIDFIDESVAKEMAERVKSLKEHWRDRGLFNTLGASAYIDNNNISIYKAYANKDNRILYYNFRDLYLPLIYTLQDHLDIEDIDISFEYGAPGFHIFDSRGNNMEASIHVDEPFKYLFEPDNVKETFSFTVPLELPSKGGGLNWWADNHVKHKINYELGKIYLHHYGLVHQIANDDVIEDDELRITLQGHGVQLNGYWFIYF